MQLEGKPNLAAIGGNHKTNKKIEQVQSMVKDKQLAK